MKEPKVMTFEEWLIEYYPNWEDEDEADCPDCEGTGKVECPTCGDGTLECETCKGDGTLNVKDNHRAEYDEFKIKDLEAWNKWNITK